VCLACVVPSSVLVVPALPMTLAEYAPTYAKGDRILCMGVGSGLNTALMEITW